MIKLMHLRQLRRLNWTMLIAMLLLIAIGVAFIYSAGYGTSDKNALRLSLKQLLWIGLGVICFLTFAMIDYRRWIQLSVPIYVLGLILLVLVFVPEIGHKVYGARRWIQIGKLVIQPAELMKLAVIFMLAGLFGSPGRNVSRFRYVLLGMTIVIFPMLLIMKQPDLGTALIFLPIPVIIMFIAGVPLRILGALLAVFILMVTVVVGTILLPPKLGWDLGRQEKLLKTIGISSYQRNRITVFFKTDVNPLGAGWNKAQSQLAVGSGGLRGKGYLRGTQNILGFLPRTVAPNDFIFSVIAEEKGFIGSVVVLTLFILLTQASIRAIEVARDKTGRLLCAGIVAILFCHVFINIGMTIGMLPITGLPLPLISYGGTFMIGTMSALGIVQSVYIRGDWR